MRSGQCFKSSSLVGRLGRRSLRLLRLTIRSALGAVVSLDFRAALAQIERVGIRRRCRQRTGCHSGVLWSSALDRTRDLCISARSRRPRPTAWGPKHRPQDARILVGQGHHGLVPSHPTLELRQPLADAVAFLPAMVKADFAPWISSALREPSPRLVMRPKLALPPVAFWLGTRPSRA